MIEMILDDEATPSMILDGDEGGDDSSSDEGGDDSSSDEGGDNDESKDDDTKTDE